MANRKNSKNSKTVLASIEVETVETVTNLPVVVEIDEAAQQFIADCAIVATAVTNIVYFDWSAVKAIMLKYQHDADAFRALTVHTWSASIAAFGAKCMGAIDKRDDAKLFTAAEALELAQHDTRKDGARELTTFEKDARKSARNSWFYVTKKTGVNNPTGGEAKANNKAGANGTPKMAGEKANPTDVKSEATASTADRCAGLAELKAAYQSFKMGLTRLQANNVSLYDGEEGSKLLAKHMNIVQLLNGIK